VSFAHAGKAANSISMAAMAERDLVFFVMGIASRSLRTL
jgi:hypothetical protein